MTSTDWPYDARRDDPLTAMRIPVIGSTIPHWGYLIALCINENPESALAHGLRPTDAEAAMVRSAIDWERSRFREGYVAGVLDSRPLDIDGGHNTITLIKRGEGDWAYRRDTWEFGPHLVPDTWMVKEQPVDLPGLLDRIWGWGNKGEKPNPAWEQWKTDHPDVFEAGDQPLICIHCDQEVREDADTAEWTCVMSWSEGGTGTFCGIAPDLNHHLAKAAQ
jgi:hypothetical protein